MLRIFRGGCDDVFAGTATASCSPRIYEAGPFATYDVPAWPWASGRPSQVVLSSAALCLIVSVTDGEEEVVELRRRVHDRARPYRA